MLRQVLCAALIAAAGPAFAAPASEPGDLRGRTLLLVDDHHVLYRAGTERVAHPAQRRTPESVVAQEFPWELMIGWSSIYRHPKTGKYQLWYQAYSGKAEKVDKSLECVVAYAESDDGITFVKPKLNLFPFGEHKQTNIVLVGNGLEGTGDRYANAVIVDEKERDPSKRYKMAYYDWSMVNGRPEPGLHVAFSPDGVRWTKHAQGPLYETSYGRYAQPPFSDEDPFVETPVKGKPPRRMWGYTLTMSDAADVIYDPLIEKFVIYGKMWIDSPNGSGAWKHAMGRTQSEDFLNWSKPQLLLTPDDLDPPDRDFHTTPVFQYGGMYFCLNQLLNRKDQGTIDVELATSRDGFTWERLYRDELFLPHNPQTGTFDGRAILSNATPVVLDDEIRFYYGAYNLTPIGGGYEETRPKTGVGMASIPRDRFGGVRPVARSEQTTMKPVDHTGQVTLKPMDLRGVRAITVNADATDGEVRIEVLDAKGYRVRHFAHADAVPIKGDGLRHAVKWKSATLGDLPPGLYSLRIHLKKATVYAVSFE